MKYYLAVEGGGTRTVAGFYADSELVTEGTAGPSNPLAYGSAATAGVIAELAARLVPDDVTQYGLLAGIAGVVDIRIGREIAGSVAALPCLCHTVISTDLHPLLYAHTPRSPGVLAIAGTGGSVLVHDGIGGFHRLGGRGPVMGDEGSAYQIVVCALRAVAQAEDGVGPETALQYVLPSVLALPDAKGLVPWSLSSSKGTVAELAKHVAEAAASGDDVALHCLTTQADALARLAAVACTSAGGESPVPLYLNGGVFDGCAIFRNRFLETAGASSRLVVEPLRCRGHQAVLALRELDGDETWCYQEVSAGTSLSSTEGQSDDVSPIDQLESAALVAEMTHHEAKVGTALRQQASTLTQVVDAAGASIRNGGRIIYVGAGTSGRLGVLDASECPPTFGTAPDRVVGIMAGGDKALRVGVEGAEDDEGRGVSDLEAFSPTEKDIVIGIAASGTTPYVLAGLKYARSRGATTALLCCNPQALCTNADHVISLPTGPEVLPGSTRLNAGTATKVALNIISTGAMAQSGYVYAGHMVKMNPSNKKLRARARRMLALLAEETEERSASLLEAVDYQIPVALIMARLGVSALEAKSRYADANECLHDVLKDAGLS